MKFIAAKASATNPHTVHLYSRPEDIAGIGLNENEENYVKEHSVNKKLKIIRINRYHEFLYLVCIASENRDTSFLNEQCRIAGSRTSKLLKAVNPEKVLVKSHNDKLNAGAFGEGLGLGAYRFLKYFTKGKDQELKLKSVEIAGADRGEINNLNAALEGTYIARNLVNEPLSFLTATQLSREAKKAGEKYGFKVEILNKKRIETLKMGGLLAVNKGSQDPPTFTIMEHQPVDALNSKPIVLVGKGVVYDTGGMSLKPTAGSMDSMKSDMAGAAAVIGAMVAIAKARLPLHIVALVPATDNRPGENAYVPGDVIKMYDGTTVEVLNTDAEGRMILADALTYAKKYKPELVIDLATLTGAAAIAIGKYGVVAMGNAGDKEFNELTEAGKRVYERIARFPFWDEYNELLKSSIADVKNIGGREGGAITAGKFLERFTDYPYIHLDIAGPAFLSSEYEYRTIGGTGVGVRLLFDFLKNRT